MKPEKQFSSELTASFKQFCKSHQIYYHLIQNDAFTSTTTFTHKKDFDGLVWATGDFDCEGDVNVLAMEYKAVNKTDRWYLRELKDHQIAGLQKAESGGAWPYILLNFRGLEGKEKTMAFMIPLEYILEKKKEGVKSLVWNDLIFHYFAWALPRIKLECGTYGWDVRELFLSWPYEKKENQITVV